MLPPPDLRITVKPVGPVAPAQATEALGDPRQEAFQRSLQTLLGQSLKAEVLSRFTDGSFLVKVAGTSARMMLPSNPQPGAELPLTLVSLTPRPTFQLSTVPQSGPITAFVDIHPQAALPVLTPELELYAPTAGMAKPGAAGATQRAATLFVEAPLANQLAQADSASSRSTLSVTARVISSVLVAASRSEHPQTAIVAPLPLLPSAPVDPVKLAAVLKDAIGASGLFYESHVAEWSAGKRPFADLQREPQMQRTHPASVSIADPVATAQATLANAAVPATAAPVDPATAQFINLQLTSQEQGRVAWQGQLWPGHDLSWQISRDAPERGARHDGAEPPEAPWRSALKLRFPSLGEIGATVVLSGDQLHIQLQAGSDQVGALLREHAGALRGALEGAGSTLVSLTVGAADEHADD
jgi:hypothetical protein